VSVHSRRFRSNHLKIEKFLATKTERLSKPEVDISRLFITTLKKLRFAKKFSMLNADT